MSCPTRIQMSLVCCLTLAFCNVTAANNNLFLPGDAFFPTTLTADALARLKADDKNPPVFKYSTFGAYEFAFCGYAGYNRAKVPCIDVNAGRNRWR